MRNDVKQLSPCDTILEQQGEIIAKIRYCGVNRRKCCTVASQAAILMAVSP